MANPTPSQLQVWLKGFPRDEAEQRIRDLERELAGWRDALALHDEFTATQNGSASPPAEPVDRPNRPDAIRRVLRERGEPMAPGDIKDALIERGWLEDAPKYHKRFYSAMSTMTKRGHLLRLQDGRYMLPPSKTGGSD